MGNLAKIRHGSPAYGPETLFRNLEDWVDEKKNDRYNRNHAAMTLVADRSGLA